eukprot:9503934-Pyramimonas_sp.AAC.1
MHANAAAAMRLAASARVAYCAMRSSAEDFRPKCCKSVSAAERLAFLSKSPRPAWRAWRGPCNSMSSANTASIPVVWPKAAASACCAAATSSPAARLSTACLPPWPGAFKRYEDSGVSSS